MSRDPADGMGRDPKADPPPAEPSRTWLERHLDRPTNRYVQSPTPPPADLPAGTHLRQVSSAGTISMDSVAYKINVDYAFQQVLVSTDDDTITVTDLHGVFLAKHTRAQRGVTYVGNGRRPGTRSKTPRNVTDVP